MTLQPLPGTVCTQFASCPGGAVGPKKPDAYMDSALPITNDASLASVGKTGTSKTAE